MKFLQAIKTYKERKVDYLKKQSPLTYGLALTQIAFGLSVFSLIVWGLENIFFIARPSLSALFSALVVIIVSFLVWGRLWLLSFYPLSPENYINPQKKATDWLRGNIVLVLLATLPNAYFLNPYDSQIMAFLFIVIALLNVGAISLFKKIYVDGVSLSDTQKPLLKKAMIVTTLPYCIARFLPR